MGCGPQVGPFLSRPTMGSIRGEGTPPTNPSRHLKKERSVLPLKWLLKGDLGRRPTAASAAVTAAAPQRAATVPAAEAAASPCLDHVYPRAALPSPPLLPPPQAAAAAAAASELLCCYFSPPRTPSLPVRIFLFSVHPCLPPSRPRISFSLQRFLPPSSDHDSLPYTIVVISLPPATIATYPSTHERPPSEIPSDASSPLPKLRNHRLSKFPAWPPSPTRSLLDSVLPYLLSPTNTPLHLLAPRRPFPVAIILIPATFLRPRNPLTKNHQSLSHSVVALKSLPPSLTCSDRDVPEYPVVSSSRLTTALILHQPRDSESLIHARLQSQKKTVLGLPPSSSDLLQLFSSPAARRRSQF